MIQTAATPAVGLPQSGLQKPYAQVKARLFISDYLAVSNVIDTGDEVLNAEGNYGIRHAGTATTQVTSGGVMIAAAGDTTLEQMSFRITGPDTDPIVNLLLLNSDETKRGADRCVNVNVMNFDLSVIRAYAVVLSCNPAAPDDQGTPGYDVVLQPFSSDRYIHVSA